MSSTALENIGAFVVAAVVGSVICNGPKKTFRYMKAIPIAISALPGLVMIQVVNDEQQNLKPVEWRPMSDILSRTVKHFTQGA